MGIRGFESILPGGIPPRAEILLLAPSGSEPALMGAHWLLEGLAHGERVMAILSGESPEAFFARLGRMGIDAPASIASGALVVVDWFTAWTQAVEGIEEVQLTLRASRKPEDLLAAIDRALEVLLPAAERRAFVDVLPVATKALDATAVAELLAGIRSRLSAKSVASMFIAERATPERTLAAVSRDFLVVLDCRGASGDLISLAAVRAGGERRSPHYRSVRLREDGASVEPDPSGRTFSCPICGARVPFDAGRCPSCKTIRADMVVKGEQRGLMDYLHNLGANGTGRTTAPRGGEPRAPGFTNGTRPAERAPGRVNGIAPGRVNGIAPGRVNGVAPGRVNGLGRSTGMVNGTRTRPDGITNGLADGLRRARGGITNGITNGSGFTNGLGGRRARQESRRARWKLGLVPLLAAVLLISPLLAPEPGRRPPFAADGDFSEWAGVPGYAQAADPNVNPAVALTAYKVATDADGFHLLASVAGSWFSDGDAVDALYAFVHVANYTGSATGYRVLGMQADFMAVVEGSGGAITSASLRRFTGSDPDNWTAWTPEGSVVAAAVGGTLELGFPWDRSWSADPRPTVLLLADDGHGGRSYSAVAFGPEPGALRATVSAATSTVNRTTEDLLAVDVAAFGGPVTVTGVTVDVTANGSGGSPLRLVGILPNFPVTVSVDSPQSLRVKVDASSLPEGSLITANVTGVEADRPVLLVGGPIRAYVVRAPSGKFVDGWFRDWTPPELETDTDTSQAPILPDRDIRQYAANRTAGTLYLYMDVKGTLLAGTPIPVRRAKETGNGTAADSSPVPAARIVGGDVLRIYVDVDPNQANGTPVFGLRGADVLLEVRGIHGRIVTRAAYEWRGSWVSIATPTVGTDEHRLEASLPVLVTTASQVVFQTIGWEGPADVTSVAGTRGVRPDGDGYAYEGQFTATFAPSGRVEIAAKDARLAWTLPDPYGTGDPAAGWSLEPTETGVRYARPGVEVRYSIDGSRMREDFVLERPGLPSDLTFPLEWGNDTLLWVEEGAPIEVYGSQDRVFELETPYAVDAAGRQTPLRFEPDLNAKVLRVPLPSTLDAAAFPLTIDPTTQYTLQNNGDLYKAGEQFGYSVAVGDFNNDGYADVLTGAPANSFGWSNNTKHGAAYIYLGPFSADRTTPDVSINGTGALGGAQFGIAVAAGKFNDDDYWDALISRISSTLPGPCPPSPCGVVGMYYGSSSFDTTVDVQFQWPSNPRNFGQMVAAGNVDNAYYDDVLIAEPGRSNGGGPDGVVYLYKSPFSSTVTTANYTLFPSSNQSGQIGVSLAVGKIDSDDYPDIVAGEPFFSTNAGRLQFFKGIQFVSGSGNRYPNATISAPSGNFFGYSVAVGRLNSDTYADMLVGAPGSGCGANGTAYIFLANSGGTGLGAGAPDVTIPNQGASEGFGCAVAIADLAGDGVADALVSGPFYDSGGETRTGRVYWFNNPLVDTNPDASFTGSQNVERFGWSLAAGKFATDARTQLAIGAYLWDKSGNQNDGRVAVVAVPEGPLLILVAVPLVLVVFRRLRRHRRTTRSGG